MEIGGVVTFAFEIPDFKNKFSVPFVVKNNDISSLIVEFNIIEYLVKEHAREHFNPILKLFPNLKDGKTELVTIWRKKIPEFQM